MSDYLIQYAFSAGELSEKLHGRADLDKFGLGLAEAYNFFIDYRGGASTRAGTEFVDYLMTDDKAIRIWPFKFSPDDQNTYVMVFGENYIRFVQSGAYVLETAQSATSITQANPGVVTITSHGFSNGDWVVKSGGDMTELLDEVYEVAGSTTNTFTLKSLPTSTAVDTTSYTAYTSGATFARIYTVTTTYTAAQLADRRFRVYQDRDEVTINHPSHPTRILTRSAATSWTLAEENFSVDVTSPTNVSLTPSSAGTAGVGFAITAVVNGEESLPSLTVFNELSVNYTTTAGSMEVEWDAVDDAHEYRIYRTSVLPTGSQISHADELAYVGVAFGPRFVDNNILPDFTRTPPQQVNPFADSTITSINMTASGTGYAKTDTVSVSGGGGSGFEGYPVIEGGEILAVIIKNGGSGYSSVTVSFSGSGSGATATATIGAASGNNPYCATIFEQRKTYMGTDNFPMTLEGSRVGLFDNFSTSNVSNADDAYSFTIDSQQVTPIRHGVPAQGGLLVFSEGGVWQVSGRDNQAISPLGAEGDPQTLSGASHTIPIQIENDVVYIQQKGSVVKGLTYNFTLRAYQSNDLSVLSNHLFENRKSIRYMAYADEPSKVVWAVRTDGALLSLTYVREQKVFAWARHFTKGLFEDVVVVEEDDRDVVYLVVKRYINGRWTRFLERMMDREISSPDAEDYWGVDCGLRLPHTTPAADLTPSAATGTATFTASASVFTSADVGKVLRVGGGKATITSYTSGTVITGTLDRDISDVVPEDDDKKPLIAVSGTWTLDSPVTTISGLGHLEGESVAVLADGNAKTRKTVSDGAITISPGATKITAGIPYSCHLKTLPLTAPDAIIEGRRARAVGIAFRRTETRGLKVGPDASNLYEMKDRTDEDWGEATSLGSGTRYEHLDDLMLEDRAAYFQQDYPLPATVVGLVFDVDVGDDPD